MLIHWNKYMSCTEYVERPLPATNSRVSSRVELFHEESIHGVHPVIRIITLFVASFYDQFQVEVDDLKIELMN